MQQEKRINAASGVMTSARGFAPYFIFRDRKNTAGVCESQTPAETVNAVRSTAFNQGVHLLHRGDFFRRIGI